MYIGFCIGFLCLCFLCHFSLSSNMPWKKRKIVLLAGTVIFCLLFVFLLSRTSFLGPQSRCISVNVVRTTLGQLTNSVRASDGPVKGNLKKLSDLASMIDYLRLALDEQRFQKMPLGITNAYRQLKSNLNLLEQELGVREFRANLSNRLSAEVQQRIRKLQNPDDCKNASKLYCNLNNPHGLASGVHDLLWCFVKAYYSQRMLVVMSQDWHYTPTKWESYFQPLSQKCTEEAYGKRGAEWPGDNGDMNRGQITKLPLDLADELLQLSSYPLPWWYGQFLGFALRPNAEMEALILETVERLDFKHPVVGLHIRRSDKIGKEATFHSLDEYMKEVEAYFAVLEESGQKLDKKRVFLASDDPQVYQECLQRYPKYHFLQVASNTSSLASSLTTRYNQEAVKGTLLDLYILAKTDYIVCTLSSGFCRLAYELMQYHRPNALDSVFSLDSVYFYAYISNPLREAMYNHNPTSYNELQLEAGDFMVQRHMWSVQQDALHDQTRHGMTRGVNLRTNQEGFYSLANVQPVYEFVNGTVD